MPKLRVRNHTDYRTDDLARFFRAGLRAMGARPDKHIEVRPSNGRYTHSCATVGVTRKRQVPDGDGGMKLVWSTHQGTFIRMLTYQKDGALNLRYFARVFEHEVLHSKGARHKDMTAHQLACDLPLPEWAEGFEIRKKEPKPVPSIEERRAAVVRAREKKAREMLVSYERKLKRLAKLKRKWAAKVRYYERRNAAMKGAGDGQEGHEKG